ncbi:MAG TPA: hypothetical protein VEG38_19455 [Acidimicrobiia bacterium]|nr:hypothetical protein [Acidimicrobiia bacterium]
MATVLGTTEERRRGSPWARKYPPLLAMAAAVLIAVTVLPSALNLPQANPTETLEYAPVPPSDEDPPPPPAAGNLASLGMASSPGIVSGPAETGTATGGPGSGPGPAPVLDEPPPPPVDLPPAVKTPSTKRCVGKPPRQTEDPLAPPCVASFTGDNFGVTYQGVTKEEVAVLFYFDGFINDIGTSRGQERRPMGQYFDLLNPPTEDDHVFIRVLRGWQRYFNDRFQTYDRFVHFYAYFAQSPTPESRRADAADTYAKIKPFATISYARENADDYLDSMAKRGVLNFASFVGRSASFFSTYPKLIWGYLPSIEVQARQFSSYVCSKVVPHPVSFSGNPNDQGKPRVLGLLSSADENFPELKLLAELAKSQIEACGGKFALERTFPRAGVAQDASNTGREATDNMLQFQQKGVTTIIWPGGLETKHSQSGALAGYRPEIVLAGDRLIESRDNSSFQDKSVWDHALVISNVTKKGLSEQEPCFLAHREADGDQPKNDVVNYACEFYEDLFQLFTGIQVAGPRLGPTSIDKGFHAIPHIASTNPAVPACFYEVGDYTCVKDAVAMWWDSNGRAPGAQQAGCWRMVEGGKRYLTGTWPPGDVMAQRKPDDPCNNYGAGFLIDPRPPSLS